MVINKYLAEAIGTFILVLGGSMSILAVSATQGPVMAVVPFGFGLSLLAGIYAVGHVSGGHFNPAVTFAMWLDKRTSLSDLIGYWISQVVGGVVGAAVLLTASSKESVHSTNTYPGAAIEASNGKAFLIEFVLTLIFVLVILASTKKAAAVAGVVIPLTLVAVHLAGIPFSGASVNPARTLGPALIGGAESSLWIYMVAPLAGAAIAWVFWRMFGGDEPEA